MFRSHAVNVIPHEELLADLSRIDDIHVTPTRAKGSLQTLIDESFPNETVILESTTYNVEGLVISHPLVVQGSPGSTINVTGGSIVIECGGGTVVFSEVSVQFTSKRNQIVRTAISKTPSLAQAVVAPMYKSHATFGPNQEVSLGITGDNLFVESTKEKEGDPRGDDSLFLVGDRVRLEVKDCHVRGHGISTLKDIAFNLGRSTGASLLLKSTTVINFYTGVEASCLAEVDIEGCYFSENRHAAVKVVDPRGMSIRETIFNQSQFAACLLYTSPSPRDS
eukprot:TRINITY_DN6028_c0_g1_i1.p1 TRINITY_DN6028_c0_g1~~TRINITY_DN6028_c0_g1_i1.p1  ORF type:complete len:279 (+),score=20.74 TRINITY_DN6028_c0_g1_i1:176-1012(+)